jgi:hypothetical protein
LRDLFAISFVHRISFRRHRKGLVCLFLPMLDFDVDFLYLFFDLWLGCIHRLGKFWIGIFNGSKNNVDLTALFE